MATSPTVTVARARLNQLVDGGRWGQRELARTLLTAQPVVRQWLEGTSRPGPAFRICLAFVAGIPETDWLTEDERQQIEHVRELFASAQTGAKRVTVSAPKKATGRARVAKRSVQEKAA